MTLAAAWALLRQFWWIPLFGVMSIAILEQRNAIIRNDAALVRADAVMTTTIGRIEKTQAAAKADDEANARRVERAQSEASQETASEYEARLRAALALAQRLRASAQPAGGVGGQPVQPGSAVTSAAAGGARPLPVMDDDDLLICTENTLKAQGWLAWWKRIKAIPR